jgi:hypothetical protein
MEHVMNFSLKNGLLLVLIASIGSSVFAMDRLKRIVGHLSVAVSDSHTYTLPEVSTDVLEVINDTGTTVHSSAWGTFTTDEIKAFDVIRKLGTMPEDRYTETITFIMGKKAATLKYSPRLHVPGYAFTADYRKHTVYISDIFGLKKTEKSIPDDSSLITVPAPIEIDNTTWAPDPTYEKPSDGMVGIPTPVIRVPISPVTPLPGRSS